MPHNIKGTGFLKKNRTEDYIIAQEEQLPAYMEDTLNGKRVFELEYLG
jgi:hypothetical protein